LQSRAMLAEPSKLGRIEQSPWRPATILIRIRVLSLLVDAIPQFAPEKLYC
jgi:hypothetical protein